MSASLERGAQKFWGLSFDPFSELPLQFENPDDYNLLVKTVNINAMNNIYSCMENDRVSKIYILLGERGCGKSTALQYLQKLIEQQQKEKNHLPIYCGVNLIENNLDTIRLSIHYTILDSLIRKISEDEQLSVTVDVERPQRINDSNSVLNIETEIVKLIKEIHKDKYQISIFIDDLDKAEAKNYPLYERYFKTMQSFYTNLCTYPTFIVIAMLTYFGRKLEASDELGYLGKKIVEMKSWNEEELETLLSKRLELAYVGPGRFHLSKIFDSESLHMIFEKNGMLPRYIINGCRRLMQKAHEASEIDRPRVTFPCRPIKKVFCNYFSEFVVGHGIPIFVSFKEIHGIVLERHQKAYDLVKKCMDRHENLAYEIADGIFTVWKSNSYHNKGVLRIIENFNIIHSYRVKRGSKYEVESIVNDLLSYLYNTLDSNDESVKHYFIESRLHLHYS